MSGPFGSVDEFVAALDAAGSARRLAEERGIDRGAITKYARQNGVDLKARANKPPADRLGRLADLIEASGISLDDVAKVKSIRVNEWQGMSKDENGEPVITDMRAASIVLEPSWSTGPEWPVVQYAQPVTIKPAKVKAKQHGLREAVILPDVQIGYRRDAVTGAMSPFHDEDAMSAAMMIVADLQPETVVILGDLLDLPEFSRHPQEPAFAQTTQAALNRAHAFLAEVRASSPDARIVMLAGNHDIRLQTFIMKNAAAAFGLQPANTPEAWPVLSIPSLLRLDEISVEYVDTYPGKFYINENICCTHGHRVNSGGSTAALVVNKERESQIFGHVHRIEAQYKSQASYEGAKTYLAASPGCLCRIDGAVPGSGPVDSFGRPGKATPNWNQGCAVVAHDEVAFHYEQAVIFDGVARFRGREYDGTMRA